GTVASEHDPADSSALETPFVRIAWQEPLGIVEWQDRMSGDTLLRAGHDHTPFAPVYEVTPVADRSQICSVRGAMGLNRKGPDVQRSVGRLVHGRVVSRGPVFTTAELRYETAGLSLYDVVVRALVEVPQVDVSIRLHKESVWEPENLYIALPFGGASPSQVWLDKAGALVRPFVDQLPGTLTDFSSVQAGVVITSKDFGIAVATPDTNLIQLGPLAYGPRRLAGAPELEDAHPELYAWVMTNYWETNFAASLGGFYEFRYSITWGPGLSIAARAADACRVMSMGPVAFRLGREET
ncbi:MAG: glycoside hydrolase, partial [Gemmatimonadales bacterium]|nr:glycoside hydrolase [Gemmatimonadales bacterium]